MNFLGSFVASISVLAECAKEAGKAARLREVVIFLHQLFVVPSLGGIEPERSAAIPVKTGPANGASTLRQSRGTASLFAG